MLISSLRRRSGAERAEPSWRHLGLGRVTATVTPLWSVEEDKVEFLGDLKKKTYHEG